MKSGHPEAAPPDKPRRLALVARLDRAREELARAVPRLVLEYAHNASSLSMDTAIGISQGALQPAHRPRAQ